jgi:alpha-amylase
MPLRFVFGLHDHQPIGNFDGVFEQNFRDAYLPFLELIEQYPEIPFSIHHSGCLLEWLVDHRREYVARLEALVQRGQAEILGGAFYEPILPAIPRRDRIGQIRTYTTFLEERFHCKIRGLWLAERVWEPELVSDLAEAGIEFTLLDDYHFRQAGMEESQLFGYYLSEDEGRLVKVFPISEPMRYIVPWKEPADAIQYFREVSAKNPDAVIVCADDGEKFGGWPETHKHCYTNGWLKKFFDLLRENRDWVQFCTLAQALDATPPAGTVYLPDCSYREMTEWALPTPRLQAYNRLVRSLDGDPRAGEIKRFLRGGFWRNFKVKYPEVHEMYCRMLEVSRRVAESESARPHVLTRTRRALYRGQCNCAYWHGAFGGLYLPHLRNAVYQHLLTAESVLFDARKDVPPSEGTASDFNLDTRPEACLRNRLLAAYFIPHRGGSMYELDLMTIRHNLLATLSRRPETYHETILQVAGAPAPTTVSQVGDQPRFKQQGLDRLLHYDPYPRKSLIDHFYPAETKLDDLVALRAQELGDFVTGGFQHELRKNGRAVQLQMRREGRVGDAEVRVAKHITLATESDTLTIRYQLERLPRDRRLIFAVEFNFAGLAANEENRYFYLDGRTKAGQLQTLLDVPANSLVGLVDDWLGLDASLAFSRPAAIWALPIQTVSQSEGGFEMVHQSNAVLPHWTVEADAEGRWEVGITLQLDTSRAEAQRMLA